MELIKNIIEMIDAELCASKDYIKCAIDNREKNPSIASVFYDLSKVEMGHVHILKAELMKILDAENHEEHTHKEKIAYDYIRDKDMERETKILVMQEMFDR